MKSFVKIFVLCLLFANPNKIWAQEKQAKPYQLDLDKADYAFKAKKYNTAAQLYQKVYPKIKDEEEKQQILFSIAESYRNSNNFKKALQWFEEVVNSKYPDPAILFSTDNYSKTLNVMMKRVGPFMIILSKIHQIKKGN